MNNPSVAVPSDVSDLTISDHNTVNRNSSIELPKPEH